MDKVKILFFEPVINFRKFVLQPFIHKDSQNVYMTSALCSNPGIRSERKQEKTVEIAHYVAS